jgi:hypothetical protein
MALSIKILLTPLLRLLKMKESQHFIKDLFRFGADLLPLLLFNCSFLNNLENTLELKNFENAGK